MHWEQKCTGGNELPDAGPGNAPKGMWLGLGGGVNAFFWSVSCSKGVKIHEGWLKLHNFQCIGGGCVPVAMSCQMLGQAMDRKAHRLDLAKA